MKRAVATKVSSCNVNRLSTDELREQLLDRGFRIDELPLDVLDEKDNDELKKYLKFQKIPGLILRLDFSPPDFELSVRTIRHVFDKFCEGLEFVDFNSGKATVYLRFIDPQQAQNAIKLVDERVITLSDSVISGQLLVGEDEKKYWETLNRNLSEFYRKKKGVTHTTLLQLLTQALAREQAKIKNAKGATGMKPSTCTECLMSFLSKNELFRHLRTHNSLAQITPPSSSSYALNAPNITLLTVYENDFVKVISKPQGLSTMVRLVMCV